MLLPSRETDGTAGSVMEAMPERAPTRMTSTAPEVSPKIISSSGMNSRPLTSRTPPISTKKISDMPQFSI